METKGYIQIHITGEDANMPLSPSTYDIKELREMLDDVVNLLYPNNAKKNRPIVSYQMLEGSVIHRFTTTMQTVAQFAAVLSLVVSSQSLDGLELPTAMAFENIQKIAKARNYIFIFSTSQSETNSLLQITAQTDYRRSENLWVDTEFYFYGLVVNAGGKKDPNIHLDVKGVGVLTISSPKEYLKKQEKNLLYHECGVRTIGKKNLETGDIDYSNLVLLELTDYSPKFDQKYLDSLIDKAYPRLKNIDSEEWIHEMRGGYEYV
ncbi:MAG: hypothetical protein IJZ86_09535 [Bacteroides sp.]|nr:hypothetical protein [Bacteroides sp.]